MLENYSVRSKEKLTFDSSNQKFNVPLIDQLEPKIDFNLKVGVKLESTDQVQYKWPNSV